MPFARPTLAELIDRVRGDLRGRLEIDGPLLRRAMADVLGAVWGGAVHTLYGFLDWLSKQVFGTTAEREALLRMAAMYGITPVPATYFACSLNVTGTVGATVPTDTIYRLDAVNSYRVVTGQTLVSDGFGNGVAVVLIKSVLAGADANLPEGATISLETSIPNVNSPATVATGSITAEGVDEEGTEEVRDRYLLRLREPPEGGADQDYEAWALAVPGVTRAWVYPNENGLGTVVVRFVMDGNVSIFPDPTAVAAVQAAENAQRPVTAAVTAVAPTNLAVAFTIHVVPDTTDTRAAVAAELADLLTRVAAPGDVFGRGTVLLSQVNTAIGTAEDVTDYVLTVPSANVAPGVGQLATVGAITWV